MFQKIKPSCALQLKSIQDFDYTITFTLKERSFNADQFEFIQKVFDDKIGTLNLAIGYGGPGFIVHFRKKHVPVVIDILDMLKERLESESTNKARSELQKLLPSKKYKQDM